MKKHGLSDIEIKWKKYGRAKLSPWEKHKANKIMEENELLIDVEIFLWFLNQVIVNHRPDLYEELPGIIMFEK